MTGYGDNAGLLWMLEVTMAATGSSQIQAIGLHKLDCFPDFHARRIAVLLGQVNARSR